MPSIAILDPVPAAFTTPVRVPELLAPAGNGECARPAVATGAAPAPGTGLAGPATARVAGSPTADGSMHDDLTSSRPTRRWNGSPR